MKIETILIFLFAAIASIAAASSHADKINMINSKNEKGLELATFGSGCFWCTEAIFQQVDGVEKVESGYMGGHVKKPTYKEVCSGLTGHAEVIQVTYNAKKVSYDELLEIFWKTHDPTTLNRQGADVGTQYRSAVFYHTDEQKQLAEKYKIALTNEKVFDQPIVTEITAAAEFYKAEDYHQNYFNLNGNVPYCSYVIQPKVEKFKKVFKEKLKKS
jgi:peptide-methionine (S)-S-oxide reductase